jgi:predicted kinase
MMIDSMNMNRTRIYFLQGCHGSGKTNFIASNGLQDYTVSIDEIITALHPTADRYDPVTGEIRSHEVDVTRDTLSSALDVAQSIIERRMQLGSVIIVDWLDVKRRRIGKMIDLASKYRYGVSFVDVQRGLTLDEAVDRSYPLWPQDEVMKTWTDKHHFEYGRDDEVITPAELASRMHVSEVDLSPYDRVNVVGDIQGCFHALERSGLDKHADNEYTIFCGDLFDRGPADEAGPMFDWLVDHISDDHMTFVRGNHDSYIKYYGNPVYKPYSKSTVDTINEIMQDAASVRGSDKMLRRHGHRINDGMVDFFPFRINGKHYFASHAGVHPNDLPYTDLGGSRTYEIGFDTGAKYWYGTGLRPGFHDYRIDIDKIVDATDTDIIQFHGHRNEYKHRPDEYGKIFNLETGVEKGGKLSTATIVNGGVTIQQF